MKILHVSSHDAVGGRFTGYDMRKALKSDEHQVEMAVWEKSTGHAWVHEMRPGPAGRLRYATKAIHRLGELLGLDGLSGLSSVALPCREYFRQADVVHLHLIHNGPYFSLLPLPYLSRLKPLVWTIHDNWALSGMCVYSFDCERWLTGCAGRCPYPRGNAPWRRYMPALHWQIKRQLYRHTDMTLVAASAWMVERVRRSPLLGHLPLYRVPFGIDLNIFAPRSKTSARMQLGLPPDTRVLAFRAAPRNSLSYDYKGVRWLREALEVYMPRQRTALVIFQDTSEFEHLSDKYQLVRAGWADGEPLVQALNAADLFLMPSLQESFGLMAIEAMACGTPVLVFAGTSLPEVIREPEGGQVLPARDSLGLAAAIQRYLEDDTLLLHTSRTARMLAEREYSLELYTQRHLQVYATAVEQYAQKRAGAQSRFAR